MTALCAVLCIAFLGSFQICENVIDVESAFKDLYVHFLMFQREMNLTKEDDMNSFPLWATKPRVKEYDDSVRCREPKKNPLAVATHLRCHDSESLLSRMIVMLFTSSSQFIDMFTIYVFSFFFTGRQFDSF